MSQINGDNLAGSRGDHTPVKSPRKADAGHTKWSNVGGGRRGSPVGGEGGRQPHVFERLSKVDSNKSSGRGGGRGQHQQQKVAGSYSSSRASHSRKKDGSPPESRSSSGCSSAVCEEERDSFTEKQEQENLPETVDKDLDDVLAPPASSSNPPSPLPASHTAATTPATHLTTTSPAATPSIPKSPKPKALQKPTTRVEVKKAAGDEGSRGAKVGGLRTVPQRRGETAGAASRSKVLEQVWARVGEGRPPEAAEARDADKDVCEADFTDEEREFYKISVKTRLVSYDNSTLVIRNTSKLDDEAEDEAEDEASDEAEDEASDEAEDEASDESPAQPPTLSATDLQTSSGEVAVGGLGDVECCPSSFTSAHPHQQAIVRGGEEAGRVAGVRRRLSHLVNRGKDFLSEVYSATQNRLEQYARPGYHPAHPNHFRHHSDTGYYYSVSPPIVEVNPLWSQEQNLLREGSLEPLTRTMQCRGSFGEDQWDRDTLVNSWQKQTEGMGEHDDRVTEDDRTETNMIVNTERGEEGSGSITVDEEWIKKNILCTCRCRQRRAEDSRGEQGGRSNMTGNKEVKELDTRGQEDDNTRTSEPALPDSSTTASTTPSVTTTTTTLTPPRTTPPSLTPPGTTPPSLTPPGTTPPSLTPPGTKPPSLTPPGTTPPTLENGDEENSVEEAMKATEGEVEDGGEVEEYLCYCSCHEGQGGEGEALPHRLPQEVQDLLDADHARMWWTITGNFGNILPIDWSKTYTRQQYLPVLNLNQMKEGSSSEDEGVEESSPSTDSANDPPTRPCPPHIYADKLRSMSVGSLNENLMELEVVVRQYSETLITQLALRDELEYEKELKNSFISLLLQVQNKRRNFNVEKKRQKKVGPNGTDPKYLTTVIPYDVGHGPPLNPTLQILIKILTAINEDSPTVPTLLTDYILKVLCPS